MNKGNLQFSTNLSFFGVLSGVAVTLGLPYIILVYGKHLSEGIQVILILLAVIGGGLITLTAVFFGIVIPKRIEKDDGHVKVVKNGTKKTVSIDEPIVGDGEDDGKGSSDEDELKKAEA
jgi:hypothetical protein